MRRLLQGVGTLLGFGIIRVSGPSMAPALQDGDFVLFRRLSAADNPCPGAIVIVRHQHLGTIIKLLGKETGLGQFSLHGLSAMSMASNHMGAVARQNIIGQAVLRIGSASGSRQSGLGLVGLDVKDNQEKGRHQDE